MARSTNMPDITFRQLEIYTLVCRETSYGNAALEARTTRANIKRICENLQSMMGRNLFDESPDGRLHPNAFGRELLDQARPLTRCSRRLADFIQGEHDAGRIVRFAAPPDQFQGGIFTDFVKRFGKYSNFRPCFLMIEESRMQSSLLNAECDVYFGLKRSISSRFDTIVISTNTRSGKRSAKSYMVVTRKNHPYAELLPALTEAALT